MNKICGSILKISQKVASAIRQHKAIVALESTIISHGMPYPQNKSCALSIEKLIQEKGAVPATVAIFNGKIHVGLEEEQFRLLSEKGAGVRKVSRRDLPQILVTNSIGATTVSATMIIAQAVGIDILVTGGIGGVHRGFQRSMDVSVDLDQLGRTAVAVVSAGAKSVMDIPRTLQYLETKGVPVLVYKSKYFPEFFSVSSTLLSPFVTSSEQEAAKIIMCHQQLGFQNGLLVAVPHHSTKQQLEVTQKATKQAIQQSQQQKIKGPKVTPFLLQRVNQLTQGQSLKSNIQLVHNNAEVGAKIAVELNMMKNQARLRASKKFSMNASGAQDLHVPETVTATQGNHKSPTQQKNKPKGKIIAIGCSGIDYHFSASPGYKFELSKSSPGTSRISLGGVARNIAQCTNKLGINTTLISALGNDIQSNMIRKYCQKNGINLVEIQEISTKSNSAKYYQIMNQQNNQMLAITQMEINNMITFDNIQKKYLNMLNQSTTITSNDIIVIDPNIQQKDIKKLIKHIVQRYKCMIFYEGKNIKTKKIIESGAYEYVNILKINQGQKQEIAKTIQKLSNARQEDKKLSAQQWLGKYVGAKNQIGNVKIKCIITNGPNNITLIENQASIREIKVAKVDKIEKTTGAGDCFSGTFLSMILRGKSQQDALIYARAASKINLETPFGQTPISDKINLSHLESVVSGIKDQLI